MTRSIEAIQADLNHVVELIGFCQEHALIVKHERRAEALRKELQEARAAARGIAPKTLNDWAALCHDDNRQWWHDLKTGERLNRNKGELLMLIVSEVAEVMEGERKGLMDDKLPHRRMAEVELADALIRIFDYAGAHGYDLDGAVIEKRSFNKTRADHTAAARLADGGKKW